ncbi:tRNA 2-thiouridine(34) synthase MnmA [Acholeplasma sp. OttesenSCG-928-E16]|nr:tRNA 2-thiouridine(34) synthase MnmA [Acholeplasma sp. OttesenSCG-928-E16]
MKKKVLLGLSGGVDSAVALHLLLEEGYDVEAVFMRNWDSTANNDLLGNPTIDDEVCSQEKDYNDAKAVADHFNVKLHRVDFIDEYWDRVFGYFLSEYNKNRTPNPDILCNNEIKFKAFIDYAMQFNPDYFAMGHYARVSHQDNQHQLLRAIDNNKDQTYFLSQLTEDQIAKVLFPIGNLKKEEVRKIAKEQNIPVFDKKDSTGICFIGERHFNDFLKNYLPAKKGPMTRLDGTYIKDHFGLMNYTIGQRKGLGIGGTKENLDAWYVVGKDLNTRTLFVEPGYHHEYLYSDSCIITDVIWRGEKIDGKMTAKFRYRQEDNDCQIKWIDEKTIHVSYPQKVRAVTPGQACAFYLKEVCLGGGFIDKVYYKSILRKYS